MWRARCTLFAVATAYALQTRPATTRRAAARRGPVPLSETLTLEDVPISAPLVPCNSYLLVETVKAKEETASGLILTGKDKDKSPEAVVVSVCEAYRNSVTGVEMPRAVEEGERVIYGKQDGIRLRYKGKDHVLLRDGEVQLAWKDGSMTLDAVRPVLDKVIVKVIKVEEQTLSGIALAPGAVQQARTSMGEVVKVGPGRLAASGDPLPMEVAPGDFVKFRDLAGFEVKIDNEEYVVCRMMDCLCKWN